MTSMDRNAPEIQRAAYWLMRIWEQYGETGVDEQGRRCFNHICMSAGEGAADFLSDHGYGDQDGWLVTLNDAGMALFECDGRMPG